MKKWLMPACRAAIVLLCTSNHLFAQHEFTVRGELGKDQQGMIRITYSNRGEMVKDSVNFKDGRFTLSGKITSPTQAVVVINPLYGRITYDQYMALDQQEFYLSPGVNTIEGKAGLKTAKITNGKEQASFRILDSLHRHFESLTEALMRSGQAHYEAKDSMGVQLVRDSMTVVRTQSALADSNFILSYPDCFVAFDLFVLRYETQALKLPEAQTAFERFTAPIRESYQGKLFAARIAKARHLAPGTMVPDINLLDTTGQQISLSSLRGKYVLLGFWTTLSGGTPAFMQSLEQIRLQVNPSTLQIYAVGISPDWNFWTQTLSRHKSSWINVIDLDGITGTGAKSETAKAFDLGIMRLPQGYLIGPEGKILAGGLAFDEHLAATIQYLIKQKQTDK
ncbi:Peroxiredoxin [Chitinophaga ginsengisegetis]|uniref:Peroxiredoxin n=1 Tax=Chitinophaga ginsengisegetis TaxID=393003 RepID=A0A1T5N6H4_9BACT|nr:TlpA disulfide reductase family protein [Chitinophaga ginsengisegetis]SKC95638.1 Peroxiredoxin [Chitinophaga ginsengisegetis]